MSRRMFEDGPAVFRAVITTKNSDGHEYTQYHGPYSAKAPATSQINKETREARRFNLRQATATYPQPTEEISGHVEKSLLVWEPVE